MGACKGCFRGCVLAQEHISIGCPFCDNIPPAVTLPTNVLEINASVRQFYEPRQGESTTMEIIFFHGLQLGRFENAYWKTWQSRNGEVIWPQAWLSQTFQNARILSITYNSCVQKKNASGQCDIYDLGEKLVHDIILNRRSAIGQNCPVYLVGHSLGGIVIKQFINSAIFMKSMYKEVAPNKYQVIKKFLLNVSGIYYYATPHLGSRIADLGAYLPGMGPIIKLLLTSENARRRINEAFEVFCTKLGTALSVSAMVEMRPTTRTLLGIIKFDAIVVEQDSARFGTRADAYPNTEADHLTVCKPKDESDEPIQKLIEFIRDSSRYQQICRERDATTAAGADTASSSEPFGARRGSVKL